MHLLYRSNKQVEEIHIILKKNYNFIAQKT